MVYLFWGAGIWASLYVLFMFVEWLNSRG